MRFIFCLGLIIAFSASAQTRPITDQPHKRYNSMTPSDEILKDAVEYIQKNQKNCKAVLTQTNDQKNKKHLFMRLYEDLTYIKLTEDTDSKRKGVDPVDCGSLMSCMLSGPASDIVFEFSHHPETKKYLMKSVGMTDKEASDAIYFLKMVNPRKIPWDQTFGQG